MLGQIELVGGFKRRFEIQFFYIWAHFQQNESKVSVFVGFEIDMVLKLASFGGCRNVSSKYYIVVWSLLICLDCIQHYISLIKGGGRFFNVLYFVF